MRFLPDGFLVSLRRENPEALPTRLLFAWLMVCVSALLWTGGHANAVGDDKGIAFFESKIRPVLIQYCYECHSTSSKEISGGLLLDSKQGLLRGGDSGPTIHPDDPVKSLLLSALRHQELKMPPTRKLPDDVIQAFEEWLRMGVPDPRDESADAPKANSIPWNEARNFWSFRQRPSVSLPKVTSDWNRRSIDTFISEKHVANELVPVAAADRSTWLRRAYIDLVGIPPTAEEVDSFNRDSNPDCFERVVEQLLASPAYGHRWGRYWLDLARYSDSNGADENHRYPVAWRYRDYVIEAFNRDISFNRFVVEQLAGDLLPSDEEADRRRLITATGFMVIGPKMLAEQDKPKLVADLVDEQIDTIGKVFLGLTLGCARCHDHKFDPISASDYYSLAGIMHSTKSMEHLKHVSQWNERELPNEQEASRRLAYEQVLTQAKLEFLTMQRRFQSRAFASQVHLVLSAMHLQSSSLEPAKPNLNMPAAVQKWMDVLQRSNSNDSDVFYVWRKLVSTPKEMFAAKANQLWLELALVDSKPNDWNSRLRVTKPPATELELIQLYGQLLTDAIDVLLDAPRTTDGKIQSQENQRLYAQLIGKSDYFPPPEKVEDSLSESEKIEFSKQKVSLEKLEAGKPIVARAMAVQEEPQVRLVAVNVRGNHLQTKGLPLDRSIPRVFRDDSDSSSLKIPDGSSGRFELASWISDPSNPLTARVLVNRVWQHHFGVGIVPTASNFGFRGESPSHPELLDWLANEFVQHDWSLKWLHREILLSSTYRLRSVHDPIAQSKDPDNRWLWRQNKHRMEAEVLRDSLLTIGDVLNQNVGGEPQNASVANYPKVDGASNIGNMRRTVYLEVNRAALSDFLATFDYVEPGVSVDKRTSTIVPHQALFLMNHPMPQEIGKQFATRLHGSHHNDADRLSYATKSILGREPTTNEVQSIALYLSDRSSTSLSGMNSSLEKWIRVCRSLLLTNEFLYVD